MERLEGKDLFQVLMLNFKLKKKLKILPHAELQTQKKVLEESTFYKTLYQKRLRPAPSSELLKKTLSSDQNFTPTSNYFNIQLYLQGFPSKPLLEVF